MADLDQALAAGQAREIRRLREEVRQLQDHARALAKNGYRLSLKYREARSELQQEQDKVREELRQERERADRLVAGLREIAGYDLPGHAECLDCGGKQVARAILESNQQGGTA